MERSSVHLPWRNEAVDSNLGEWTLKAGIVSRENTQSRRFYSSKVRSFRAESFRSNITISSSTASSPGYNFREKIDPSTYSFTTALRALQARSVNTWECLSPDVALKSKWNEAEKYICNPISGEVPVECLSSKTLHGRSFHSSTKNRFTMSAPLIHPSPSAFIQTLPSLDDKQQSTFNIPMKGKKGVFSMTKNVGVQSTELGNVTSTVVISPNNGEMLITALDSVHVKSSHAIFSKTKTEEKEVQVKAETSCEPEKESKIDNKEWKKTGNSNIWKRKGKGQFGCFQLLNLCRRSEEKHKPIKQKNIFPLPC